MRRISALARYSVVAAQLDVGAAAGHVGGDGDRAQLTGLGHDLGLLFVMLGVQDLVRDALSLQHTGLSSSDFSMEMVPTSTGWPLAWHSSICSITGRELARFRF